MADTATPATLADAMLLLEQVREVAALMAARVESMGREQQQAPATIPAKRRPTSPISAMR